ncbi:MAG: hypothetical protein LBV06_07075 [Propionibacteriaceae bacterium]|jgi:hypothetical protein|nr:hypothetical protein [Propionibacteriaceae bacterium]
MSLHLVPISWATLVDGVCRWHRHHCPPVGDLGIRVGVADETGVLVGVGCAGRPVAPVLDDGLTVEVTRVATDGTRNASSMLYGALTRAALALGWQRVITYTEQGETGASLRAVDWHVVAERPIRKGWSHPSRPRDDRAYRSVTRTLWEAES